MFDAPEPVSDISKRMGFPRGKNLNVSRMFADEMGDRELGTYKL